MRKFIWTAWICLAALLAYAVPATAQPSCFSGPERDTANYWQTWRFVNNCGGEVTVRYRSKDADGRISGIIPHFTAACKSSSIQGFNSTQYEFLDYRWDARAENSFCLNGQVVSGTADPDPDPDPFASGGSYGNATPDPYANATPNPDPFDPDDYGGVSVDPNPRASGPLDRGVGTSILNLL